MNPTIVESRRLRLRSSSTIRRRSRRPRAASRRSAVYFAISRSLVGEVDAVPAVALVADPHGLPLIVLRCIGHRLRRDERLVAIAALVPLRGDEVGVHGLVRQIENKRAAGGAGVQPFRGVVGQRVGDIAPLRDLAPVDVQPVGVRQVRTLSAEADPVVEPRLGRIAVGAHVPLPDEGRVIPGLLSVAGRRCPGGTGSDCRQPDGGGHGSVRPRPGSRAKGRVTAV